MILHTILTDMQLPNVGDIPTNYRSRLLSSSIYDKLDETTATIRLQGGTNGNVQYPPEWMDYVISVLNAGPHQAEAEKYDHRPQDRR